RSERLIGAHAVRGYASVQAVAGGQPVIKSQTELIHRIRFLIHGEQVLHVTGRCRQGYLREKRSCDRIQTVHRDQISGERTATGCSPRGWIAEGRQTGKITAAKGC